MKLKNQINMKAYILRADIENGIVEDSILWLYFSENSMAKYVHNSGTITISVKWPDSGLASGLAF
jgi:hypothetical protein